jgi:HK97 family phage major capsid protein
MSETQQQSMTKGQLSDFVLSVWKDAGLDGLQEKLQALQETGLGIDARMAELETKNQRRKHDVEVDKSLVIGRLMRALAAGKGDPVRASAFAVKTWDDDVVTKALAATDEVAGGFLVKEEISEDLIDLLTPKSVIRSLGPTTVPLDSGALSIPKLTAGAAGGWIGENTNIPKTEQTFGSIRLVARKYGSLVPISNDLLRRGGAKVDALVRDDLSRDIRVKTDLAYIRGDGTAGQPMGLRSLQGQTFAANGTVSVANTTDDLGTCLQLLGDANVDFDNPGWIMEWRTWRYLITARDGNNNLVWADEMARGTLMGFPFRVTSQIPRNLGAGTETELYFANFTDVVIGDATSILLDVSTEAAYHDGSSVVAAFSLDQTVVRAIFETDMQTRYPESIVLVTGVKWGT